MKFTTNLKPFADSLSLGIINANVSNFHKKSCMAQLSATKDTLTVNLEAARIKTEISLKGSGDSDNRAVVFVQSTLLKQLVSTLDSSTITLEFSENGLTLYSGKSKFTLPKMIDESDIELDRPELPDYGSDEIAIDKADWKFVKDNQMYAIAMSFIHPVYTNVWIGEGGDVLVGDFDNSLFTHSVRSKLGNTCLLSDTIINLFNSLPDGTKITKKDRTYIVKYESDSYTYISQFMPKYEEEEDTGSYNSDIFLGMMEHSKEGFTINVPALSKFLNQASLLSSSTEDTITLSVDGDELTLRDRNVECKLQGSGVRLDSFSVEFKLESLRRVISNYEVDEISLAPVMQDGEVAGVLVWSSDLTTILAGVE